MANGQKMNVTSADFGVKGWTLCVYMFLIYYLNTSMNTGWQNCLSYWEQVYGWDSTSLLSLVSVAQFIGITVCFVVGRFALKKSPRILAIIIGTIVTACCFSVNFIHSLGLFVFVEMIAVMGQVCWCYTLNPIFVSSWFPKKKGVVMGIVTIGVPLGAGTVAKIMNLIGNVWGLNYCLTFVGLIGLAGLLLLIFVVRDTPEEAGCLPDNDASLTSDDVKRIAAENEEIAAKSPWTTKRMLSVKETYIIALSIGMPVLFGGGFMGTNVLRMLSIGLEKGMAANLMMVTAFCACFASYFFGIIDGKWGPRTGAKICIFMTFLACSFSAGASYFNSVILLVAGLVIGGGVIGGAVNFLTTITIEYWGAANFKRAYGIMYPLMQIPGSLGTLVIMQLSSRLGGYGTAYVILAGCMLIALLAFSTVKNGDFVKRAEEKWLEKAE